MIPTSICFDISKLLGDVISSDVERNRAFLHSHTREFTQHDFSLIFNIFGTAFMLFTNFFIRQVKRHKLIFFLQNTATYFKIVVSSFDKEISTSLRFSAFFAKSKFKICLFQIKECH